MCSNKTHSFARAIEKWFAGLREVSYNDTKRVSGKEFKQLFPSESRAFSYDFRKMKSINDNDLYYIAKVDGAMRPITRQVSFTETTAPTKCGGLCRNAKGPSCDCSCKGVNHGAGSVFARSPSASVSTPQKPNLDDINIVARGYGQRAHKAGATKYNDDAQMMGFKKVYTARLKKEWVDYGKPLPDSFLMKLDKAFFDGWNSGWTLYSIDRSDHPPKYEVGQSVYWDVGSHTQPAVITRVNKFVSPIEYLIEVAAGNRGKVNVSEDSITMTPKKSPHLRFARSSASTKALRTIYNYLEVVRTEWGEDRGIEAGRELQKAAKAIAADPSSQDIAAEIAQLVRVATTDKSYDKRDRALDDLESIINQAQSQHARRKGKTSMAQGFASTKPEALRYINANINALLALKKQGPEMYTGQIKGNANISLEAGQDHIAQAYIDKLISGDETRALRVRLESAYHEALGNEFHVTMHSRSGVKARFANPDDAQITSTHLIRGNGRKYEITGRKPASEQSQKQLGQTEWLNIQGANGAQYVAQVFDNGSYRVLSSSGKAWQGRILSSRSGSRSRMGSGDPYMENKDVKVRKGVRSDTVAFVGQNGGGGDFYAGLENRPHSGNRFDNQLLWMKEGYATAAAAERSAIKKFDDHVARGGYSRSGVKSLMQKEYVLWGIPEGETDQLHAKVLSTQAKTPSEMDEIKRRASAAGWHSFRVQILDPDKPTRMFSRNGVKAKFGQPNTVSVRKTPRGNYEVIYWDANGKEQTHTLNANEEHAKEGAKDLARQLGMQFVAGRSRFKTLHSRSRKKSLFAHWTDTTKVIETFRWVNDNGSTASSGGSVPWRTAAEKQEWHQEPYFVFYSSASGSTFGGIYKQERDAQSALDKAKKDHAAEVAKYVTAPSIRKRISELENEISGVKNQPSLAGGAVRVGRLQSELTRLQSELGGLGFAREQSEISTRFGSIASKLGFLPDSITESNGVATLKFAQADGSAGRCAFAMIRPLTGIVGSDRVTATDTEVRVQFARGGKAEFGSETPQADVDPRDKYFEKLKKLKGVTYQGRGFYIIPAKLLDGSVGILRYREVKQPTNRFQLTAMGDLVGWGSNHPQQNDYRLKDWQEAFPKAAMSRIGGKATFGSDVILEDIGDDQVRATARVEGRSAGSFDGPRSQSAQLLLKALKIAGQGHEVSSGVYDMTHITLNDAAKRAMPKSAMMSRSGKAEFAHANQQIADGVVQLLLVLGLPRMAEGAKMTTDADTLKRYINVARRRIKRSDQADRFNTLADKLERMLMSRGGGKAEFAEIGSGGSYVSNALHHISNDITRGDKDMAKAMMRKLAERIGKESHTDAEWHQYLSLARSLGFSDNAVAGFSRSKTKTRFEMDQTTHRHLMTWIDNQLGNRAGSAGYIADKMIGTFNDDPEHWENQGWSKVFDAAGLSSADFNNPKKGWD